MTEKQNEAGTPGHRRRLLSRTEYHQKTSGRIPMKAISVAAILLLTGSAALAQTTDELNNDGKNTDNVLTYGMGYHQQRYSRLKEINKNTVKRLVPVWNLSLDNNWGEQAQPLIHDGVMYVTNARHTVAIDVRPASKSGGHARLAA
jgi:glucose dehydrogenase